MKIYNIEANQSNIFLLAHIATQVWDVDPEIKHTHNFVAK